MKCLRAAQIPLRQMIHPKPSFSSSLSTRSARTPNTQYRSATTFSTPSGRLKGWIKDAQKDYPILFPVLIVGCITSLSVLALLSYDELTRVAPEYSAYPTKVEQRLRLALHYTHVQPDPDVAEKYFKDALQSADDAGMDPFSKEVMGIRVRFAEMLEQFGRLKGAVGLLNNIVADCEAKLAATGNSSSRTDEFNVLRTSLLRGIIQARIKAASLYETEFLQDPTGAKQTLSEAISLLVKASNAPQAAFTEDNAAGLSFSEIASLLSHMGDLYATSGEESNAVQVYMLTLEPLRRSCNGTRSCKEVQIFSNIASTMAVALKRPGATINGKSPTKSSVHAARQAIIRWTDQAIETADKVQPAERDQMCELGLLSAEMTKADLLLEAGQATHAREMFRSLIPRLQEKNLHSLVTVAQQGLQKAGT